MTEGKPKESESRFSLSKGSRSSDKSKRDRQPSLDKPASKAVVTTSSKGSRSSSSKHKSSTSSSYSYKAATRPAAKLLVEPANHLSPDAKLERVLLGETHVISYPGTSQYSQGAPSACGLAALNAIRVTFDASLQGVSGIELVKWLSTIDAHLDATAICAHWPNRGHLEPDDLFPLPLFRQAMKVYDRQDKLVGFETFLSMLNGLQTPQAPNDVTAALITRPPEIVSIFRIPFALDKPLDLPERGTTSCIYAIFDSHSRPEHPTGAGLILLPSTAAAANYLASLLHVPSGIKSSTMQWEAQLMSQFSAHLVCRAEWRNPQQERSTRLAAVYEANAGVLRGQEAEAEAKKALSEVEELKARVRRLERELHHAHNALDARPKAAEPKRPVQEASKPSDKPVENTNGLSEDALLALRMQEEFDAEDQLLTSLAQESAPGQSFECGICFETFHAGALAPMDGCDHPYCRECMREYVQSKLESRTFPILCPTCHSIKGGATQGTVGQGLIETIGLTEQQYAIYVELSLASLSTMVHCRKCQRAAFVMRADLDSQESTITCPLPDCSHKWCKNCNLSIEGEGGHSCDGTSELKKLMAEEGWKDCPGCKTPISKNEGCYHMTCGTPGCNCHFCYRCGGLIVQSVDRETIQSAVNQHFRGKCSMFDSPVASFVQRLRR
ncbi:hypothetical protein FS749_008757 [Ceratobasidium sp. UAMH 11750]|nr:hypothetical protein FS749_008757 [Ceratobasidium sp. UAMH 11750]